MTSTPCRQCGKLMCPRTPPRPCAVCQILRVCIAVRYDVRLELCRLGSAPPPSAIVLESERLYELFGGDPAFDRIFNRVWEKVGQVGAS